MINKIIEEMTSFGLIVNEPIADGSIHRCQSNSKAKRNKDGWYRIIQHGDHFYSIFGCWVSGEKIKTSTRGLNGDTAGALKIWKMIEERHNAEELEQIQKAKKTASIFIEKHTFPASPDHPYLISKDVGVFGNLLTSNRALVLPVVSPSGEITSYQTISPTGRKRFLYQGVVAGGCFPIPGDDAVTVCVCEGYATGATIRAATGFKVLVAFNSGNLVAVAKSAEKQFPGREILVCADNDHITEKRIGKNPGIESAKKTGCRYVFPTGIKGTDFNDMATDCGIDAVKQEVFSRHTIECMDKNDCYEVDDSIFIPPDLPLPGLIGQGLEALEGDILQYSLPLVLTVISRAIAGKISLNGTHPNVFNVKVGSTSTGKSSTDKKFLRCLDIENFISMHDAASGPGIWRAVSETPQGMGMFDEISSLFIRHGNDQVSDGKINTLLDLYSRSGEDFKRVFGDSKNSIHIHNPCVSIIGNATPTIFDAIQLKDFDTGLMQRFDFWVYDGPIKKKPLLIGSNYFENTKSFIRELQRIMQSIPEEQSTLAELIKGCVELGTTSESLARIDEYSDYITQEANKADSEGEIGFVSRCFDLSLKYALIHHAAVKYNIYEDIDIHDVEWGIRVAEMISGWKQNVLCNRVVSGEFHKDCEIFKEAIKAAIKSGRKPSFSYMASRRPRLKDWQFKYSENIIGVLKKRGEIIVKEGRDGITLYHLPKKYEPNQ